MDVRSIWVSCSKVNIPMVMAYKKTKVSVPNTQSDIRKLLQKHKAKGIQFEEEWEKKTICVRFLYEIKQKLFVIRIRAKISSLGEHGQMERAVWRAVFWAIKSRMESIDFGIETFEEAFMAHIILEGDVTLADKIIPLLMIGQTQGILSLPAPE